MFWAREEQMMRVRSCSALLALRAFVGVQMLDTECFFFSLSSPP